MIAGGRFSRFMVLILASLRGAASHGVKALPPC
jgi:hypothetical protein